MAYYDNIYAREIEIPVYSSGNEIMRLTNENVVSETLNFEESICDGNFKFGGCIAGKFEIDLLNITPNMIADKRIIVIITEKYYDDTALYPQDTLSPSDDIYPGMYKTLLRKWTMFSGTVDTVKRQKDKQVTHIVAYDKLYTVGRTNYYGLISSIAQYSPTADTTAVAEALLENARTIYGLSYDLPNDRLGYYNYGMDLSMTDYAVAKDVFNGEITLSGALQNLCEMTACFGRCRYYLGDGSDPNRGDFSYIRLGTTEKQITAYKDLDYEDYTIFPFNAIDCKYNKNTWYHTENSSNTPSTYTVGDNTILQACASETTAAQVASGIKAALTVTGGVSGGKYQYRPFNCTINNPDIVLGDKVSITTGDNYVPKVESYVLKRRITGLIGMLITISAEGDQSQAANNFSATSTTSALSAESESD